MRALVLGCGSIGARHARNLAKLGLEVAVYDPDASRARTLADAVAVESVAERDQAGAVDFTVIATPSHHHIDDLGWALGRGAHAFVEKPLGASRDDLERAVDLGRRYPGQVAMVACNMRFTDGFRTLKANLQTIGDLVAANAYFGWYLPNWRPEQDYRASYSAHRAEGGGVILDAIHELDYVMSIAGAVDAVSAAWRSGTTLGIDVEELAEITLRHRKGVISSVHLDYLQPRYTRWCRVTGTNGTLLWNYAEHTVQRWAHLSEEVEVLLDDADRDGNRMYISEMEHFIDAVRSGGPTVNGIVQAAAVLDVALCALERGAPS